MQCPSCQHPNQESRVLESRPTEGGRSIRRRRECLHCKHRFTTYERIEFVPITVIKRDNRRESFDRSKLLRGIIRACEKTGIPHQRLESLVDEIEAQIQQYSEREITTHAIGELVLQRLRDENEVAYVRFASVYRQFTGIKDFVETLDRLKKHPNSSNRESGDWYVADSRQPDSRSSATCGS
ncbi:transcriptional regulator NrdR [Lusitaniella coriacea LEGE 07157]|uniref:Transcriptional repressor NrdR n=1 Tax=Lusitaniella coriacea LEGE 07157 TaxID=945747 RepID=A0A8J7B3Z1_9CYAN|nr:transcriptional regulator NrdR [Lusitaniella coriacea]MBE9115457.1 transcriptional regulator NrdR [Lusitaniella coriacea LEGE 07157]